MEKVKLSKVFVNDKSKDGKAFKTKDGKPFWKIAIKFENQVQSGVDENKYLTDLIFRNTDKRMNWKEGDEVAIKFWQNEEGFWNFQVPSAEDRMDEVEARMDALEEFVMTNKSIKVEEKGEGEKDLLPF